MSGHRPVLIRELGFLVLLALLWGSSYLFIKVAVAEIPPVTLIAIRGAIAALLVGGVVVLRRMPMPSDRTTWGHLMIQSSLGAWGAWLLLAWGQQFVDSSLASVLNSTSPLFVFLITALITRHEAAGPLRLIGALLGLAGIVLIVGVDALAGLGQQVMGQLAAVGGAMLYACAAIYGRRFSHLPAPVTAAGTMICATIVLIPASLTIDQPWTLTPSHQALGAAIMLGIFCTGFAFLLYFRLLRTLGALGVASQAYLRAGVGVLLGVFILGETITPLVGLGVLLAILGVAAINMPVSRK